MQGDCRFPSVTLFCCCDFRASLFRIIFRKRFKPDFSVTFCQLNDRIGQLKDGELSGIAHVQRPAKVGLIFHEGGHQIDEVVYIAERSCLGAITVNRDWFVLQGLHDEVGNHPAVVGMHAGAVGIEKTSYSNGKAVLALVGEEQ